MTGKRVEERPVGSGGRLLRRAYYDGSHSEWCEKTDDGWLCQRGCTVTDVRSTSTQRTTVDRLIEVVPEVRRGDWRDRFRVRWTLSRSSARDHFTNGRCYFPLDTTLEQEVWHEGAAWTDRGARKQMRGFLS